MPSPTPKQAEYLAFIARYSAVHEQAPAEADIAQHFLVSAPTVHQMILKLEAGGWIAREPGVARSIRLLGRSDDLPTRGHAARPSHAVLSDEAIDIVVATACEVAEGIVHRLRGMPLCSDIRQVVVAAAAAAAARRVAALGAPPAEVERARKRVEQSAGTKDV